ncbi:MAG: hypothetical protein IGS39_23975 [Calothrix sp. C42_A2020_038]|nr:hypothetical protein [Calothrix sp. C42_A2020_038]
MIRNKLEAAAKAREAHQQSIKKNLEHRLQVARAKGDENLIRQIEAEMNYFN